MGQDFLIFGYFWAVCTYHIQNIYLIIQIYTYIFKPVRLNKKEKVRVFSCWENVFVLKWLQVLQ